MTDVCRNSMAASGGHYSHLMQAQHSRRWMLKGMRWWKCQRRPRMEEALVRVRPSTELDMQHRSWRCQPGHFQHHW